MKTMEAPESIKSLLLLMMMMSADHFGFTWTYDLFQTVEEIDMKDHFTDDNGRFSRVGRIIFDAPDLTVTVESRDGSEIQIEAFKMADNDQLMSTTAAVEEMSSWRQSSSNVQTSNAAASQLTWVSIGHPTFTGGMPTSDDPACSSKTPSASSPTSRLFCFTSGGFYAYVDMLTAEHRRLLAAAANVKYNTAGVFDWQIRPLELMSFSCSSTLYHPNNADGFVISGHVRDFYNFPLRIDFNTDPVDVAAMELLVERLNSTANQLQFECRMSSRKQVDTHIILTIDASQIVDRLFGPPATHGELSKAVYATRNQLNRIADEIYSVFDVADNFRMSKNQFADALVEDLIAEMSAAGGVNQETGFIPVPVDVAVNRLSLYGFEAIDDRKRFTDFLESILYIDDQYPQRITVNETTVNGTNFARLLGVDKAIEWVQNNSASGVPPRALDEQLLELNGVPDDGWSGGEVEWVLDGSDGRRTRVLPMSMKVLLFTRSRFTRTIRFNRVRITTSGPAYDRKVSLYTHRAVFNPSL